MGSFIAICNVGDSVIKIPLYTDMELNIFHERKKFNKFTKKYGFNCEDIHGKANGYAIHLKTDKIDTQYAIFLDSTNYHYTTAIHESVHIVDFICDYLDINDSEFRAYLVDYISRKCIDYMIGVLDDKK
jgi:hypothetical protein